MTTYADWYNQHQLSFNPNLNSRSGPVRLTICRGDYVVDENGEFSYEEVWQEEEIIQPDENESDERNRNRDEIDDYLSKKLDMTGPVKSSWKSNSNPPSSSNSSVAVADVQTSLRESNAIQQEVQTDPTFRRLAMGRGGLQSSNAKSALLVIDTNTILCSLQFFESLFARLLSLNTQAFATGSSPAPLTIIIPYTVLLEIDKIKSQSRDISLEAREANRWILAALQAQKEVVVKKDLRDGMGEREVPLEESAWALHVQNRTNMEEVMGTSVNSRTKNDENIVYLCSFLQRTSGHQVFFLSNDINARSSAEIEGIRTIGLDTLIGSSLNSIQHGKFKGNSAELKRIVEEIVEQWQFQIGDWNQDEPPSSEEIPNGSLENGMVGISQESEMQVETDTFESMGDFDGHVMEMEQDEAMSIDDSEVQIDLDHHHHHHQSQNENQFRESIQTRSISEPLALKEKGTGASRYAHDGTYRTFQSCRSPSLPSNLAASNRNHSNPSPRRSPLTNSNSLPVVNNRYFANQTPGNQRHPSTSNSSPNPFTQARPRPFGPNGIDASKWAH